MPLKIENKNMSDLPEEVNREEYMHAEKHRYRGCHKPFDQERSAFHALKKSECTFSECT